MQIIQDYQFIEPSFRGAVAAIGNFDGVHLGHQALIDVARKIAKNSSCPLGILTFEPHPREYFAPDAPPFRLMSAEAKASQLAQIDVKILYQLAFNTVLSQLSAEEFAHDVIFKGLGLSHIIVGTDFCFGKNRSGKVADLITFGQKMGFEVTIVDLLSNDNKIVSSTAIRQALSDGRPKEAERMLGHWYRIENEVIHGEQRGRELGYPTANLSIDGLHQPKFGVYATVVDIMDGSSKGRYYGATSIGDRPTFGGTKANLEVYIFDFSADIYGSIISVALVDYQRPELKFNTLDDLIVQMKLDCIQARKTLNTVCSLT